MEKQVRERNACRDSVKALEELMESIVQLIMRITCYKLGTPTGDFADDVFELDLMGEGAGGEQYLGGYS